jgi:hypothetical protein
MFYFQEPVFENRAVYETIWKNTIERGSPQMTICYMRIAYCAPKSTNTQL